MSVHQPISPKSSTKMPFSTLYTPGPAQRTFMSPRGTQDCALPETFILLLLRTECCTAWILIKSSEVILEFLWALSSWINVVSALPCYMSQMAIFTLPLQESFCLSYKMFTMCGWIENSTELSESPMYTVMPTWDFLVSEYVNIHIYSCGHGNYAHTLFPAQGCTYISFCSVECADGYNGLESNVL